MNNKTLLCIDPSQDYELIDYELLKEMGICSVFLIKEQSKIPQGNNYILVNTFSYEDILSASRTMRPDYIVCFSEDLFEDIAKIRNILLLSQKTVIYEKLSNMFPYPKTISLTEEFSLSLLQDKLDSQEIFIKLTSGSGSYETYHVKNEDDFSNFNHSRKKGQNYIAQSYIKDAVYHSELMVYKGDVLFVSAREYTNPNHFMVSKNIPIFSLNILDPVKEEKIKEASIRVKEILNIDNGILHTEFFVSNDGHIQFIETNARPPGIGLNKLYQKKLSISMETILCCIVCGIAPPRMMESKSHFICGYYPKKKGLIKKIIQPEVQVEQEWTFFVKPNDKGEEMKHMSKSAMVVCWDDSNLKINKIGEYLSQQNIVETC